MSARKSGRPERPINDRESPAGRIAAQLRNLRSSKGNPTYREMADRVWFSAGTLSAAARGDHFPTRAVVVAFAEACGADPQEWARRWYEAQRPPRPPSPPPRWPPSAAPPWPS
ncbi:hypothetical protein GCM10022247_18510 [Allokutzneria multivorans]|uniref:Helix-turn-helix domain-containing protein n=1 Tax=Allokutzneria multivorans TaxID=1142134 RepID=A0ABP7RK10_9PSEU